MKIKSAVHLGIGSAMGLMMLAMVHGVLTGTSQLAGAALLAFVLAHVALVGVGAGLALWATRFAPGLQRRMQRMHRPSWRHLGHMLGAAFTAALLAHLFIHGGL